MSETLEAIRSAPDAPRVAGKRKTARTGAADRVIDLHLRNPKLGKTALARRAGCHVNNVKYVLAKYLAGTSEDDLRQFREDKADIMEAVQHRLLSSITAKKINKTSAVQAITGVAILEDKIRLQRGQATGINVSVLMDVVEAMRLRGSQPVVSAPIGERSAGE